MMMQIGAVGGAKSLRRQAGGLDRALGHDLDEVGAVGGGAVDVGEHVAGSMVTASSAAGKK